MERIWSKAEEQVSARAHTWNDTHQSLHFSYVTYNTLISSVLSYIWQLVEPTDEVLRVERLALKKLVLGPGMWVKPCDLWRLHDGWGFSLQFRSTMHKSIAAVLRVALTVAQDYREKARRLRAVLQHGTLLNRDTKWA